ncbi:hypothetical protein B1T49_22110 [Mycobacterium persicum]|nr:hypothetical protein B1T49_22110 [Mycobacterium persicum]
MNWRGRPLVPPTADSRDACQRWTRKYLAIARRLIDVPALGVRIRARRSTACIETPLQLDWTPSTFAECA